MKPCLVSWSGGKDSCYALMKASNQGYTPRVLLNVLNEEGKISRSHGIPEIILKAQAASLGLPIHLIASSWSDYRKKFISALGDLKERHEITHAVFGDIDLDAHRQWEEEVCKESGLEAVLPLWKQDRKDLVYKMLAEGIETIIVSCNQKMGPEYLGTTLSHHLIQKLEELEIDPCGEGGEFHTLVTNAPMFSKPLHVAITKKMQHQGYWFSELQLL